MEPISTMIFVLYAVLSKIINAQAEAASFKFKLQILQTKVERLINKLEEINKLGLQLQDKFPKEETQRLCVLLEGAADVISSGSKVRWYKFNSKRYGEQIDKFADALDEFLKVDLQFAQYKQILQVLFQVTALTKKMDLKSGSSTISQSSEGSPSLKSRPGIASLLRSATPNRDGGSSSSSRRTRRVHFKHNESGTECIIEEYK